VITGLNVPLEWTALLCAGFFLLGMLARNAWSHRRERAPRSPLADLMQPAALGEAVDLATRRNTARAASQAILRGMVDDSGSGGGSGGDHSAVQSQIAAVLRAGLRRGDRISHIDGDGFVVVVPGADERSAARIAERLRSSLAQWHAQGAKGAAGVTASFGVAAGPAGDGQPNDRLMRQARRALDAARARGKAHIVAASEIEEVLYLPAPEARSAEAAAA
jgi:diguanylate cyclase (GGDEF)-like protein